MTIQVTEEQLNDIHKLRKLMEKKEAAGEKVTIQPKTLDMMEKMTRNMAGDFSNLLSIMHVIRWA